MHRLDGLVSAWGFRCGMLLRYSLMWAFLGYKRRKAHLGRSVHLGFQNDLQIAKLESKTMQPNFPCGCVLYCCKICNFVQTSANLYSAFHEVQVCSLSLWYCSFYTAFVLIFSSPFFRPLVLRTAGTKHFKPFGLPISSAVGEYQPTFT